MDLVALSDIAKMLGGVSRSRTTEITNRKGFPAPSRRRPTADCASGNGPTSRVGSGSTAPTRQTEQLAR